MSVDEGMWRFFQEHLGYSDEQMRFKRFGCHDVGVRCGGWGHIVVELKMGDRKTP